jgi:hypothetical protein
MHTQAADQEIASWGRALASLLDGVYQAAAARLQSTCRQTYTQQQLGAARAEERAALQHSRALAAALRTLKMVQAACLQV